MSKPLIKLFIIFILLFFPSFTYGSDHAIGKVTRLFKQKEYQKAHVYLNSLKKDGVDAEQKKRIFFLSAYANLQLQRYEDALQIFKNDLSGKYNMIEEYVLYFLAETYSKKGDHTNALAVLKRLRKHFPSTGFDSKIDFFLIQKHISLGNYSTAADLLRHFITKHKKNKNIPLATIFLGRVYENLEKQVDAYRTYQKIYINFPLNDLAKEVEERRAFIKGNLSKKLPEPGPADLLKRINRLMRGRRFKQAVFELKKILKKNTNKEITFQATFKLGRSYLSSGSDKKGMSILKKLAERFPAHRTTPRVYYFIAKKYWNKGDVSKSIMYCNKILKGYPKTKWAGKALLVLGRIHEETGKTDKAIAYYNRLVKQFSKESIAREALWRIGWTYYKNNEYKKTIKVYEKIIRRYKNSEYVDNAMYWKGRAFEQLQNAEKAKKTFSALAELYPYSYYGHMGKNKISSSENDIFAIYNPGKSNNNNDFDSKEFAALYETSLSYGSKLTRKAEQLLKKIEELMILGLYDEAKGEVDRIAKYIKKDAIDPALFLSSLYFKTNGYVNYFKTLNRFMNIYTRRKNINGLPKKFWKMYYPPGFWEEVSKHSKKNKIDFFFIEGLIRQESVFNNRSVSRVGAKGLMQLIPSTAKMEMHKLKIDMEITGETLFDPGLNITLGTRHFKRLMDKFKGDVILALISYNAGSNKAREWKKRFDGLDKDMFVESIPYPETRTFVKSVMRNYYNYKYLY